MAAGLYVGGCLGIGLLIASLADRVSLRARHQDHPLRASAIAATAAGVIWLLVYAPEPNIGILNGGHGRGRRSSPVGWLGLRVTVNLRHHRGRRVGRHGPRGRDPVGGHQGRARSSSSRRRCSTGHRRPRAFRHIVLPLIAIPISVVVVTLAIAVIKMLRHRVRDVPRRAEWRQPGHRLHVLRPDLRAGPRRTGCRGGGGHDPRDHPHHDCSTSVASRVRSPGMMTRIAASATSAAAGDPRRYPSDAARAQSLIWDHAFPGRHASPPCDARTDIAATGGGPCCPTQASTLDNYANGHQLAGLRAGIPQQLPHHGARRRCCPSPSAPWRRTPSRGSGSRGRRTLFLIVVALMVLPVQAGFVPILQMFSTLGLNHSYVGIWLAHTAFALPFAIFLLRGFFVQLPRELLESAQIDGASRLRIFWRIVAAAVAAGACVPGRVPVPVGLERPAHEPHLRLQPGPATADRPHRGAAVDLRAAVRRPERVGRAADDRAARSCSLRSSAISSAASSRVP